MKVKGSDQGIASVNGMSSLSVTSNDDAFGIVTVMPNLELSCYILAIENGDVMMCYDCTVAMENVLISLTSSTNRLGLGYALEMMFLIEVNLVGARDMIVLLVSFDNVRTVVAHSIPI